MSSMYYRVMPEPAPSPRFGYKKVDRKEMEAILSRVTKPKPISADRPSTSGSITRPKSCKNGRRKNDFTEHDWQRMIRRLQRPTFSQRMARSKGDKSQQQQQQPARPNTQQSRPKSIKPQATKRLEKLCRPTTATIAKSLLTCHLCEGNMVDTRGLHIDHEHKALPLEEVETITQRVRMPTCSSHPEARPCTRGGERGSPDSMIQDVRLPLISGLDRSQTVNEIVGRLQSGKSRRHTTPAATPITVS